MKVYVITKGQYSDYRICGVSTDKDKARLLQKACDGHNIWSESRIETYETDQYVTEIESGLQLYYCETNGDLNIVNIDKECLEPLEDEDFNPKTDKNKNYYWVYVWAKDKDHARKIAVDKIAEYMAHKEGIDAS